MPDSHSPFIRPEWVPTVAVNSRILIVGASGGLGTALTAMLCKGPDCLIGAHGNSVPVVACDPYVHAFSGTLDGEAACIQLVDRFTKIARGIDALVMLTGGLTHAEHWDSLSEEDWRHDIDLNLNIPFFVARAAMRVMKAQGSGGRIILTGTESAIHGGSAQSFPYAIAKRGTECMVEGLARDGAPNGILVNGVRLGFIASGFHERWAGRDAQHMRNRADMVPLNRGGHPDEVAALIIYLMSGWASYITGQMIPLTGGDWL
ncbi:MAG: SDR family NAD(P)-dependent oxidoreductase [Rhodospirillales bacterium]|jgi:3-oxoacyl-[acyl-carrier protein] reductase